MLCNMCVTENVNNHFIFDLQNVLFFIAISGMQR